MMGTPVYMAPEQCRGLKTIGDRADVYALGVMLYEMLASRPPFWAEAPGDVIGMHMFQPPPSIRQFVPDVDQRLERLLESMLQKDPQVRPAMAEVGRVLKELGHLTSEVMPMRLAGVQEARSAPEPPISNSGQRRFPSPRPESPPPAAASPPALAAALMSQTDPDATKQFLELAPTSRQPVVQIGAQVAAKIQAEAQRLAPMAQPLEAAGASANFDGETEILRSPRGKAELGPARNVPSLLDPPTPYLPERATLRRLRDNLSGVSQSSRMGILVFVGLLLVAVLITLVIIFAGNHGE
jgi:serine/threonine protein kinase